jgi:hypothetical protein
LELAAGAVDDAIPAPPTEDDNVLGSTVIPPPPRCPEPLVVLDCELLGEEGGRGLI